MATKPKDHVAAITKEQLSLAQLKATPDKSIRLSDYADRLPEINTLLESYPEELRGGLVLTVSQVFQLVRFSQDRVFGMARTVPLNCKGEDCDFADICLYYGLGIAPSGHPCPEEVNVITQMVPQLIQDLGIDTESYVELNMVQEYVDSIVQEHRAQKYLALSNDIVPRTVGIDATTGAEIKQDDTAPALGNKERALRKKERLRKELVATRESRLKFKVSNPEDESKKAADLRRRMEEAEARENAADAEFNDIDEQKTQSVQP